MRDKNSNRVEAQLNSLTERVLKTEMNTVQIRQNSAERLETINKRFDELNDTIKANNERDRWLVNIVGAVALVFGSAVFYLWMEPLFDRLVDLEDRLEDLILHSSHAPLDTDGDGM